MLVLKINLKIVKKTYLRNHDSS